MLNSFQIYLALAPLGLYFVLVSLMHLAGRPFPVSGKLGMGILFAVLSGALAAGPIQLVFPVNASWSYGPWTWLLLLSVYVLACTLYLLAQRPSIDLYNVQLTEFRPFLSELAVGLDPKAQIAGDMVFMPTLRIQFYVESAPLFRTLTLLPAGPHQDPVSWQKFRKALKNALKEQKTAFRPEYSIGIFFLVFGLLLLAGLHILVWMDPAAFLKAVPDLLRI